MQWAAWPCQLVVQYGRLIVLPVLGNIDSFIFLREHHSTLPQSLSLLTVKYSSSFLHGLPTVILTVWYCLLDMVAQFPQLNDIATGPGLQLAQLILYSRALSPQGQHVSTLTLSEAQDKRDQEKAKHLLSSLETAGLEQCRSFCDRELELREKSPSATFLAHGWPGLPDPF